jgi:phosphate/sulfate permease
MMDWLREFWPRPFKWFSSLVGSGDPRVHGTVVIMIASALCAALILLAVAASKKIPVSVELLGVVGAMTTLATLIYNRGKKTEDLDGQQAK